MIEVNLEHVNEALVALNQYKVLTGGKQLISPYVPGQFRQFEFEDHDIKDLITSLLHLAQQLQNEGQDIDPEDIWQSAWHHFETEVLDPDDIELGRRKMEEDNKKRGRPLTPREIFAKGAKAQREFKEKQSGARTSG